MPLPGVDHVVDFDDKPVLPFDDDSVEHSEGSHVIEHLQQPLPFMQELWRITCPGGTATFRCPYGSSDDADEDPTHVRRMFVGSWGYFGQPHYWRADYGFRGDWQQTQVLLVVDPSLNGLDDEQLKTAVQFQRNVVAEMVATLTAVKPAREPLRELQQPFEVIIHKIGAAVNA